MLVVLPVTSVSLAETTSPDLSTWRYTMSHLPPPSVGCFTVNYPSEVWQPTACYVDKGNLVPFTVGNGYDESANAGTSIINDGDGEFTSITGFTSETGSNGVANTYSLQLNSQTFTCNTAYTDNVQATCWQQFIYANPYPGQNYGEIFIQYWLLGYHATYNRCPATSPPGGTAWMFDGLSSCYANSPNVHTGLNAASQLGNMLLVGEAGECYPSCDHIPGQPNDYESLCVGGTCNSFSETMYVLNLHSNWKLAEFNVFGDGAGSPSANFNKGIIMNVQTGIFDNQGFAITPTCANTGYTGETNNLILQTATCLGSSSGYMTFKQLLPSITLSPTSSSHTSSVTITVSGSGFASNSAVTIKFSGTTKTTCTSTSTGQLPSGCSFTIPANTYGAGTYTVTATDASGNSASATFTFT